MRGRDIKRYGYNWANLWIINTHNGIKGKLPRIDVNEYPAIKAHLDQYWDTISKRADKGDTPYNLRNCAYMEDFSKQQIIWIELSDEPKFALVENITSLNTIFFMTGEHILHVLGLLNSKLITWYFHHCIGTTSGVGTNRWLKYTIEQIPMVTANRELELMVSSISKHYKIDVNIAIDNFVCKLYTLTEKEKHFIIIVCFSLVLFIFSVIYLSNSFNINSQKLLKILRKDYSKNNVQTIRLIKHNYLSIPIQFQNQ